MEFFEAVRKRRSVRGTRKGRYRRNMWRGFLSSNETLRELKEIGVGGDPCRVRGSLAVPSRKTTIGGEHHEKAGSNGVMHLEVISMGNMLQSLKSFGLMNWGLIIFTTLKYFTIIK